MQTMDQFLDLVIANVKKPSVGKCIAKSIGMTILMNLISLPFGIRMVSTSRRKSNKEIKRDFESALYGMFNVSLFTDPQKKQSLTKERTIVVAAFDGLTDENKIKVLNLALTNQANYRSFLKEHVLANAA